MLIKIDAQDKNVWVNPNNITHTFSNDYGVCITLVNKNTILLGQNQFDKLVYDINKRRKDNENF